MKTINQFILEHLECSKHSIIERLKLSSIDERLHLNNDSKIKNNDINNYVCIIPRNADYDMMMKKYKKYFIKRTLDYHKGYCFIMPKKEALQVWSDSIDKYTSFYKIPETCDSIKQFCNLFIGNFFDEDNMERYDDVENDEFIFKENITERLKLNNDSKINTNNEILGFNEFIDILKQETTLFGQFIENYKVREYERHKCYVQPANYRYYYVTETYPGVGQKMLEIWSFPPNDIAIEYNSFDMDGDSIDYRVIFNKEEVPDKNWSYKYYKFKVKRSFVKPFVKFLNDIYDLEFQDDIVNKCQQFNRLCMNKKYFITQ